MARKRQGTNNEQKSVGSLHIREVTPDSWCEIQQLFGANGACGGCWCMSWRVPKHGKSWEEAKGARNERSLQKLVEGGCVHAMMAFAGQELVGWCSFGPRSSFPRLSTVRALQRDWTAETWSVVCFFISRGWRRRG